MKAPLSWIKEYARIGADVQVYAKNMVRVGNAVDGIEYAGAELENVVVGRIISVDRHPDADKLVVCRVDIGDAELQIVTGASNVSAGDLVPVIRDGGMLPGGKRIMTTKLRGVRSEGMLGSGPEMGVDDSLYPNPGQEGILLLREEYPLGSDVRAIFGKDDYVLDFDILANRPDCQCILGIARESAVAMNTEFHQPEAKFSGIPGKTSDYVDIEVRDEALCGRYMGAVVKNIRIAPSPDWMRRRLTNAGMRPINNIVDITNYVMLETGHPMHAFDLSTVRDRKIIVRRALEGETLRTLDGKDRAVSTEMLAIADGQGITGLAGIMGGEESEITENTHEILFECAQFDRTSIRLTSRALGMRTESSGRFEKGVCAATTDYALRRACQLVEMLDAGDVVGEWTDIYPKPDISMEVISSVSQICALAGMSIDAYTMVAILGTLGIPTTADEDALISCVPAWRQDITTQADIAEEILRIYGYDRIPFTLMQDMTKPGQRNPSTRNNTAIAEILCGFGLDEAYHFSFMSQKELNALHLPEGDERLRAIPVRNPLTPDHAFMRTSLVPAMLGTLSLNMSRSNTSAAFFEISRTFIPDHLPLEDLPEEKPVLCIGMYGEKVDFFALRAIVDGLIDSFGVSVRIEPGADPYYHPGRCATMMSGEKALAMLGEIHPDRMEDFDLPRRAYVAEICLNGLINRKQAVHSVVMPSKFPSVSRDLAIVVDEVAAAVLGRTA